MGDCKSYRQWRKKEKRFHQGWQKNKKPDFSLKREVQEVTKLANVILHFFSAKLTNEQSASVKGKYNDSPNKVMQTKSDISILAVNER